MTKRKLLYSLVTVFIKDSVNKIAIEEFSKFVKQFKLMFAWPQGVVLRGCRFGGEERRQQMVRTL